jgi:iron(III) transport system permease protein
MAPSPARGLARTVGLALVAVYIIASVVLPTGAIALRSLLPFYTGNFAWSDLTLANIANTLNDGLVRNALLHSVFITVVATALLIVVAFLVAVDKARRRDLISSFTALLASVPIAVPGVLFGVGLIWLYIRTPIYATIWIIVLVMLGRFLPILVRMFETALMQIGRELEEAAAVSGASEWKITLQIRLPLLLGTLRSALAIGGTQVFNELTASALLFTATSSVLPVVVFNYMFDGDYSRAAAVAILQILLLCAGFGVISLFTRGSGRWRQAA